MSQTFNLRLSLSGNIETNPGPHDTPVPSTSAAATAKKDRTASVLVTTYNVRGLKDEAKLRHLLSHYSKSIVNKNKDVVACFQETYIDTPGKVPYLWRGNYHLTPGDRNSGGCLTLLSPHISVVEGRDLGNRGHVLACQKSDDSGISFILVVVILKSMFATCWLQIHLPLQL